MALTKEIKIDKIEIVGDFKQLQIREATIVLDDGQELSRSFNRYILNPGMDISDQPADIQSIANAVWTEEVINAYSASQAQSLEQ